MQYMIALPKMSTVLPGIGMNTENNENLDTLISDPEYYKSSPTNQQLELKSTRKYFCMKAVSMALYKPRFRLDTIRWNSQKLPGKFCHEFGIK